MVMLIYFGRVIIMMVFGPYHLVPMEVRSLVGVKIKQLEYGMPINFLK